MTKRLAKRLLIIGWDAADWKVIDPLLAQGAMPNLKWLIDGGVRADLASLDPKLSPILWTSIATGKTADKHGILNFLEPDPANSGVRVSSSSTRRTKALWNILTQRELSAVVVNWYASHPAEPILGACVSNVFQESSPASVSQSWPLAPGSVHPPDLRDRIADLRIHPSKISRADVLGINGPLADVAEDDRRRSLLRKLLAQTRSVRNVALDLLSDAESWACAMVFFDAIDVAGHHFMQFHPPRMEHVSKRDFTVFGGVMNGMYRLHDRMLGELLECTGPDTTVILLSDHGFFSDHLRPKVLTSVDDEHAAMDATWHRPFGVLVIGGPGIQPGANVAGASLLDIAPTALTLLGLPVGADMDGRVLIEALQQQGEIERVTNWDAEPGEAGQHPADLRIDPFEAHDAMRQLADLGYIQAIGEGDQRAVEMVDRETRSNLGIVYMSTRRPREACAIFERLHAEHPSDQRFAMNLAYCQQALGQHAQAESTLRTFLAAHPDAPEAKRLHAGALIAQRRFADAARVLEDDMKIRPGDPDLLCTLAEVYAALDRHDEAERAARRAVTVDPHHAASHHALARLALMRRNFEHAAEHALDALGLRQTYADAHHTLGVALAWLGDLDHAAQSFRLALSLQPGMIDSHRFLAAICARIGDDANAQKHREAELALLRTAATTDPSAASASYTPDSPLLADSWARSSTSSST